MLPAVTHIGNLLQITKGDKYLVACSGMHESGKMRKREVIGGTVTHLAQRLPSALEPEGKYLVGVDLAIS